MSDSTRKASQRKDVRADKPTPDFPLFRHALGYWSKKIRGRIHHFGRWGRVVKGVVTELEGDEHWQTALAKYSEQAEALYAGRTPRPKSEGGLTVKDLCNRFLNAKHNRLKSGEIGQRMFADYLDICQLIADTFGKDRVVADLAADDFEKLRALMAEKWGPVRLANGVVRVKSVFRYGVDNALVEKVRFGSEFVKPAASTLRKHKAASVVKMLEPGQVRKLIDAADVPMKAMIYLGLNCGFGNMDISTLPLSALDLDKGWLEFPRPKTGVKRRCKLWPETVSALKDAIAARPLPLHEQDAGLVFLNVRRLPWVRVMQRPVKDAAYDKTVRIDLITVAFARLVKRLSLPRVGFYALRHIFRTVADASRDQPACDAIMGHSDPSMAGHYRERIDDDRLAAVSEHVRKWLFAGTDAADLKLYAAG